MLVIRYKVLWPLVILSCLILVPAACDTGTGSDGDGDDEGTPPDAPVLLSPENGAVDVELRPLFTWSYEPDENRGGDLPLLERPASSSVSPPPDSPATDAPEELPRTRPAQPAATSPAPQASTSAASFCEAATSYTLQVDDDPGFANPEIDIAGITVIPYQATFELARETTYHWRVRAHNDYGDSDWSETWSFTTLASVWLIETVDSIEYSGEHTSLVLDSSGYPHISYLGLNDLKYAAWNGSSWDIETVDSEGDVGQCNSLALNHSAEPRISYIDADEGSLKFAEWFSSGWRTQTVDSRDEYGNCTSLVLDDAGKPHIYL